MANEENIIYQNQRYQIEVTPEAALQETGKDYGPGYLVRNRATGVVEFTHMQLPNARYVADSMEKTLNDLESPDRSAVETLTEGPTLN